MTHHPPKLDKPVHVNSLVTSDPIKKFVEKRAEKRVLCRVRCYTGVEAYSQQIPKMSAAKRAKLEAPSCEINGGLENGYHDCQNGVEDENKAIGGLSKREIMRLRSEHIG